MHQELVLGEKMQIGLLPALLAVLAGRRFARAWGGGGTPTGRVRPSEHNPLWRHFSEKRSGPGIWKWTHYFAAYDRHLARLRGRAPVVVEVGIYSGGSLPMWREYFGPGAVIHGIDIEPACRVYQADGVEIHIGDQSDSEFWTEFRRRVPRVDVLIDDGGHKFYQQRATLEAMLPHIAPGGVYVCEDVHGSSNQFAAFVAGLSASLMEMSPGEGGVLSSRTSAFQSEVASIHSYPFLVVIERNDAPVGMFTAPKQGTLWQPFL